MLKINSSGGKVKRYTRDSMKGARTRIIQWTNPFSFFFFTLMSGRTNQGLSRTISHLVSSKDSRKVSRSAAVYRTLVSLSSCRTIFATPIFEKAAESRADWNKRKERRVLLDVPEAREYRVPAVPHYRVHFPWSD